MSKFDWINTLIILVIFAISFYLYPTLPEEIPIHWNLAGEVDGYGSPEMIFLFPAITLLVCIVLYLIPYIAVFKKNIKEFKHFESMKTALILFFTFIYMASISPILGYTFNMTHAIIIAVGLIFIYFGLIMPSMKRNFFMGVRTPWTLASDKVWDKTHRIGGKIFVILGILIFAIAFVAFLFVFIIAIIILAVIGLFVYSYIIWKLDGNKRKL